MHRDFAVNGIGSNLCDDETPQFLAWLGARKAVTNSSSPASFLSFVTVFIELIQTTATMKAVGRRASRKCARLKICV